jgi:hypothetical protein
VPFKLFLLEERPLVIVENMARKLRGNADIHIIAENIARKLRGKRSDASCDHERSDASYSMSMSANHFSACFHAFFEEPAILKVILWHEFCPPRPERHITCLRDVSHPMLGRRAQMPLTGVPFSNESIGVLFLFFTGVAVSGEAAAGLFNASLRRGFLPFAFLPFAGGPSDFSHSSSLAAFPRVSMR